jgi:cytochrome c-type biogenesis protein CcmI
MREPRAVSPPGDSAASRLRTAVAADRVSASAQDASRKRMAIWVVFALMTGAAVFALLWPLSRRPQPAAPDGSAEAVLATETGFYEDQLRDIERDAARGLLAPQEAEAARAEAAPAASRRGPRHPGSASRPCATAARPPPSRSRPCRCWRC